MIVVCHDCPNQRNPDLAKIWYYPCQECREQFIANHELLGHVVTTRPHTHSDLIAVGAW